MSTVSAEDQRALDALRSAVAEALERKCRLGLYAVIHLIAPTHSEQFLRLMTKYYPTWREARQELNELPLAAEAWNE